MNSWEGSPLQLILYCLFGVLFVMGLIYLVPFVLNAVFYGKNKKNKKNENNSEDQSDWKG